jgi:bifunctional DNA-binding transcriptional regulator/antitoxin component of YhaV-PrlF toxin-antitoxin module
MISHMMRNSVTAPARMRARNQLTLPEPVVEAAEIQEGDRFLVEVTPGDPDTVRLHRIRSSYAGALREIYGDATNYIEAERASWESTDER